MNANDESTVVLEGRLSLRNASEIRDRLKAAVDRFGAVSIDVRDVAALDASIIQILVAARKYARRLGRGCSLLVAADSPFEATLVRAGVLGSGGACRTSEDTFWTPGEVRKS